jgi:hypothetical protein
LQVAADGSVLRARVNVTVELLEILKVVELDSLFSCKINLLLTWVDQVRGTRSPNPGARGSSSTT